MENQTVATTETNFRNVCYALTETARLSVSKWQFGSGFKFSVAIVRKQGRGWKVDQSSVTEGGVWPKTASKASSEAAQVSRDYKVIDFANPLIVQELGEMPVRFYRDNIIQKGKRA